MRKSIAVLISLAFLTAHSFAWGPEGHRVIADVARARLTPATREQVKELLGNDDLAAISVWADDVRHTLSESFAWHFVDIPTNASGFSQSRDCYRPNERYPSSLRDHHNCVVDQITGFKQILADRRMSQLERVEALKFLVHFVADIHQPMHAIGEARGGNDIHVTEFGTTQCGKYPCNLHYAWDIGLIEHTGLTEEQYVVKIQHLIASEKFTADWIGTPETWANESFRVAKEVWLSDGSSVDQRYYERTIPIVNARLQMAGMRLAVMLNQALGK